MGNASTVSADPQLALGHILQKTPHSVVHEGVLELLHQDGAQKTRIGSGNVSSTTSPHDLVTKLHMSPSRESAAAAFVACRRASGCRSTWQ